ncbi:MAG: hypothetical protein JWN03_7596 [Nocardia sp.]|uniref:hypothetical protein n=1 Tax=Nocardia sp. TaxID=1821 RepID=UPI00260C9020|nr:hypothetical protein [Nocardia sp.]MCU1647321.1 hypothetical protein [Nocardia sp.]
MTISEKAPLRHRLARALVMGSLVVLPIGFAAPVLAAPLTLVDNNDNDNGWRQDCDHSGQFSWQQDRGQWRMSDCDQGRGHWERRGNDWQWHHDHDDAPAPAPWNPFGSL